MESVYLFLIIIIAISAMLFVFFKKVGNLQSQLLITNTEKMDLQNQLQTKQSKSFTLGINNALGGIHELIGKFDYFTKLDDWWLISGPSKQAPIDMLGIKDGVLKIVEFKKKGARITTSENAIRRMVEEGNVEYETVDVEIPESIIIEKRELKPIRKIRLGDDKKF